MSGTSTRLDSERGQEPAPDLSPYVGEWVVLHNGAVIEHGHDLQNLASKARARGIQRPRVLFVAPVNPAHAQLGL